MFRLHLLMKTLIILIVAWLPIGTVRAIGIATIIAGAGGTAIATLDSHIVVGPVLDWRADPSAPSAAFALVGALDANGGQLVWVANANFVPSGAERPVAYAPIWVAGYADPCIRRDTPMQCLGPDSVHLDLFWVHQTFAQLDVSGPILLGLIAALLLLMRVEAHAMAIAFGCFGTAFVGCVSFFVLQPSTTSMPVGLPMTGAMLVAVVIGAVSLRLAYFEPRSVTSRIFAICAVGCMAWFGLLAQFDGLDVRLILLVFLVPSMALVLPATVVTTPLWSALPIDASVAGLGWWLALAGTSYVTASPGSRRPTRRRRTWPSRGREEPTPRHIDETGRFRWIDFA